MKIVHWVVLFLVLVACDDNKSPRRSVAAPESPREYVVKLELRQCGDSLFVDFGSLEVGGEAFKAEGASTRRVGRREWEARVVFYGR